MHYVKNELFLAIFKWSFASNLCGISGVDIVINKTELPIALLSLWAVELKWCLMFAE